MDRVGRCKHERGLDNLSSGMELVSPMRSQGRSLSAGKTAAVKEPIAGSRIKPLSKTYSSRDNVVKIDYRRTVEDKKRGTGVNDDSSGYIYSAARAMTLQQPQLNSRKKNRSERQREFTNHSLVEKNPALCQSPSNISPHYKEGEDESEDEAPGNIQKFSAKSCGSFPRLCSKNSLNILVPIAGMKIKNQLLHSTPDIDKSCKGSHLKQHSHAVKKAWDAVKNLGSHQLGSPDITEVRNKFSNSSRFNDSGEPQKMGRSSPCRTRTPQPSLHGKKFLGFSKGSVYDKPLRSQSAGRGSNHRDAVNSEVSGALGPGKRIKEFQPDQEHNSQEKSAVNMKNIAAGCAVSPLPPPLPKSPSDSWLQRTLPAISFRNSFPRTIHDTQSHANTKNCDANISIHT